MSLSIRNWLGIEKLAGLASTVEQLEKANELQIEGVNDENKNASKDDETTPKAMCAT
jgi:hypothetical protein